MRTTVLLATLLMSAGCEPGDRELEYSTWVEAAAGAVLALDDGATLTIPPGALAEDAEVTLSRETCSRIYAHDSFASCLYSVDSDGIDWSGRYELALPSRPGTDAQMVQRAEDGYRPLMDTTAVGDLLMASGSRSTQRSARVLSENPEDDRCTDAPFEACGGTLQGKWKMVRSCGSFLPPEADPYATCQSDEALVDSPFTLFGHLDFLEDGSTMTERLGADIVRHELVSLSCLRRVDETCPEFCTVTDDICDCVWPGLTAEAEGTGAWSTTSDTTVELIGTEAAYCVQDDALSMEKLNTDGELYQLFYERVQE